MSETDSPEGKGMWTTPYAHAGGAHSLTGSGLAEVAREVLARGSYFRFFAPGGSMSPFIRDGDVITLVPFDVAVCAPGIVVAFVRPERDRLTVHRVISVAEGHCYLRGDNNPVDDGRVPFASIIGTVTHVERKGRPVRFGIGPEGVLIASLSRRGWLCGCLNAVRSVYSVVRRFS